MDLENKIDIVKNILKDKKVAIGFSGGADSTLIAYLSSKVAKDTLAITIDNHLLPKGFVENTVEVAKSFGIKHEVIDINFYDYEYFLSNDEKRCYTCRNLMYAHIEKVAEEKGFDFICDGNNISDLIIDRPGILVTYKKDFKTPFIKAKLSSKEIHEYLKRNNIPYSRSTTCLATRIPTNTKTTFEKIDRISYCEDYILKNTACEIVKVRDLGKYAIVEVDNLEDILKNDNFSNINLELKKKGFRKVALNMEAIDDDEYIEIDYSNGSFAFQLPFTINIENTLAQLENEAIKTEEGTLVTKNITIHQNGLIRGHDLANYGLALDAFMEILPKIRRNVTKYQDT